MSRMMSLGILAVVAAAAGIVASYGSRLQATSLWAGKALSPPESAQSAPRGIQDALLQGFESWLGIIVVGTVAVTGILAFLVAWWSPILIYLSFGLSMIFSGRTFVPMTVDWYLLRLHVALANREADYAKDGDELRADAARSIDKTLLDLYAMYAGTGVLSPTMKVARTTKHGDEDSLLMSATDLHIR